MAVKDRGIINAKAIKPKLIFASTSKVITTIATNTTTSSVRRNVPQTPNNRIPTQSFVPSPGGVSGLPRFMLVNSCSGFNIEDFQEDAEEKGDGGDYDDEADAYLDNINSSVSNTNTTTHDIDATIDEMAALVIDQQSFVELDPIVNR